eukprot:5155374-Lingulodinium_polyedra.AAC.1
MAFLGIAFHGIARDCTPWHCTGLRTYHGVARDCIPWRSAGFHVLHGNACRDVPLNCSCHAID